MSPLLTDKPGTKPALSRTNAANSPADPSRLRRAQPLNQPLPATWRWIAALPVDIRPLSLVQEFPRIANVLARQWQDLEGFEHYLDSLLHDRRGGRRGFPGQVHSELLTLRDYHEGRYPTSPARS